MHKLVNFGPQVLKRSVILKLRYLGIDSVRLVSILYVFTYSFSHLVESSELSALVLLPMIVKSDLSLVYDVVWQ